MPRRGSRVQIPFPAPYLSKGPAPRQPRLTLPINPTMTPPGQCRLCGAVSELQESHVLPAFIYRWLRDTSANGHMRSGEMPNKRIQDGHKRYWLCPRVRNSSAPQKRRSHLSSSIRTRRTQQNGSRMARGGGRPFPSQCQNVDKASNYPIFLALTVLRSHAKGAPKYSAA